MGHAKHALARGDDPAEIGRRLADHRAHDKHDPLYYARLTVSNAQGESSASDRTPSTWTVDGDWNRYPRQAIEEQCCVDREGNATR